MAVKDQLESKTDRLGFRVSSDTKALIEQAAQLQGVSVSDFITAAAYREAVSTVETHEVMRLNRHQSEAFVRALLEPPAPNDALKKLMRSPD